MQKNTYITRVCDRNSDVITVDDLGIPKRKSFQATVWRINIILQTLIILILGVKLSLVIHAGMKVGGVEEKIRI